MNAGDVIQTRYELTEVLGRGGMAEVWQAEDSHLGRPVAIKFLAPQLSSDPEFLVRFFSEAQAVAGISHPNVVRVLDFGEYEESPFLVMECVTGGPLTDKVGEPHEPDWAFEVVAAAARAAGAAHEKGIVHRDIKPGNILMDQDGNAKLADFGIASSGRSERLTATGAAIGSPHYISPEQASGGEATPASDVYALGIVLYELLTGVRPFEGDNITAVAIAHVDQEPAAPSTHVPEVGAAVDAIVLKCLAKDPAHRYSDGAELASALERFDPAVAPVVALESQDERPLLMANRKMAAAAAAVLLLVAVSALAAVLSGDEPVSASTSEGNEGRLPNVGGLKFKSPSPSVSTDDEAVAPSPTPTTKKERAAAKEKVAEPQEDQTADDTTEEEEPMTEPEPTPAEEEPTPEPTGSPAP